MSGSAIGLQEACPGCGGQVFTQVRMLDAAGSSMVMQCVSCGLLRREGMRKELSGQARVGTRVYRDFQVMEGRVAQARDRIWRRVFPALRKYRSTGRLLDIGCSRGHFVAAARQQGWSAEGIEPSAEDCVYARKQWGLDIRQGAFVAGLFPAGAYDAVTLWNVLDHVIAPGETLAEIHRLLRPGGLLCLRVPNGSMHLLLHRLSRRFGIKDYSIFHNYAFDAHSLRVLLGRAGFAACRIVNGVPSTGDPYGLFGALGGAAVDAMKLGIFAASQAAYYASAGRLLLAPSYVAFAEKSA